MTPREFYNTYWLRDPDRVLAVIERAGTNLTYFRRIMYGSDQCGAKLARRLEEASDGEMKREHIRPELFG